MPVPGEVANPEQLRTADVSIPTNAGPINGYLAQPTGDGHAPGIIVIHEAFGLVDHIKDLARRFANIGFNAIAPDLYTRTGSPIPGDMESLFSIMLGLDDDRTVKDLEGCAALLRGLDNATDQVGVIGFCSGGRQTLLVAFSSPAVNAAVDCWGGFIHRAGPDAETTPQRPTPVIDLAPNLHCPLYVVIGGEDQNPSPAIGQELEKRLANSKQPSQVEVFADAGHAFLADYRPSYNEKAAFALWPKAIAFFEEHLR